VWNEYCIHYHTTSSHHHHHYLLHIIRPVVHQMVFAGDDVVGEVRVY
jgi:hypothetical protein